MKKIHFYKIVILFIISILIINKGESQVLINSSGGTPHVSSMLEIQSNSKGLLIPRLTTAQRTALAGSAVDGLLVFDSGEKSFYIFGNGKWTDLSMSAEIWAQNATDVYLSDDTKNVGIGTTTPSGKFVVKADASQADDDALFEIQDKDGFPIFVVTSEGARVYVKDFTTKGVSGGFAVGRYGAAKGMPDTTYFMVTPDSTRVYSRNGSTGVSGGFAVGRYGAAKGTTTTFFTTNEDSTRVYSRNGSTGVSGGFAVGRYGAAKGEADSLFFFTNIDSTRVYTDGSGSKGVSGGFAVGRYGAAKGPADNYMHMTKDNYLIGHSSGKDITNGQYNTFFGYETGFKTTGGIEVYPGEWEGSNNIFVGYQSGYDNVTGYKNVFVGYKSGTNNSTGSKNTFVGNMCGYVNTDGGYNSFFGYHSGISTNSGSYNTFSGADCGFYNSSGFFNTCLGSHTGENLQTGHRNTFVGTAAGHGGGIPGSTPSVYISGDDNTALGYRAGFSNVAGDGNVFLGYQAGYNETASDRLYIENTNANNTGALIWGNFSTDHLRFNAKVGVNIAPSSSYRLYVYEPAATTTSSSRAGYFRAHGGTTSGTAQGVRSYSYAYGSSTSYAIYADADGGLTSGHEYAFYGRGEGYFSGNVGIGVVPDERLVVKMGGTSWSSAHFALEASANTNTWDFLNNGTDLYIGYNETSRFLMRNGSFCSRTHKDCDLGENGRAWDNIYYDDLYNQGAAAFTDRSVTEELIKYPPKPKTEGMFDYKTDRGLLELDPNSLPKDLTEEFSILTDEMTTYNYKANYEQQLQINEQNEKLNKQEMEIEELKKQIQELKNLIQK